MSFTIATPYKAHENFTIFIYMNVPREFKSSQLGFKNSMYKFKYSMITKIACSV